MLKRLECQVSGRVQFVMYRDYVTRNARALDVQGMVKNNPDGTVGLIAEGEEKELQKFLLKIKEGSFLSRVDEVKEFWSDPLGGFNNFDILY